MHRFQFILYFDQHLNLTVKNRNNFLSNLIVSPLDLPSSSAKSKTLSCHATLLNPFAAKMRATLEKDRQRPRLRLAATLGAFAVFIEKKKNSKRGIYNLYNTLVFNHCLESNNITVV